MGGQANFPLAQVDRFVNIVRWYDYLQNVVDTEGLLPKAAIRKPPLKAPPPPPPPAPKACPPFRLLLPVFPAFDTITPLFGGHSGLSYASFHAGEKQPRLCCLNVLRINSCPVPVPVCMLLAHMHLPTLEGWERTHPLAHVCLLFAVSALEPFLPLEHFGRFRLF
jgi:hypothetical protein